MDTQSKTGFYLPALQLRPLRPGPRRAVTVAAYL
jgi:hypothetical protein